jgi:hypothetical protein
MVTVAPDSGVPVAGIGVIGTLFARLAAGSHRLRLELFTCAVAGGAFPALIHRARVFHRPRQRLLLWLPHVRMPMNQLPLPALEPKHLGDPQVHRRLTLLAFETHLGMLNARPEGQLPRR